MGREQNMKKLFLVWDFKIYLEMSELRVYKAFAFGIRQVNIFLPQISNCYFLAIFYSLIQLFCLVISFR